MLGQRDACRPSMPVPFLSHREQFSALYAWARAGVSWGAICAQRLGQRWGASPPAQGERVTGQKSHKPVTTGAKLEKKPATFKAGPACTVAGRCPEAPQSAQAEAPSLQNWWRHLNKL